MAHAKGLPDKIDFVKLSEDEKIQSVKLSEEEVEKFSLDETVKIIDEASVRIECSMLARARALLLYHRVKPYIDDYPYDRYLIAGACLDLCLKYCEEIVEFDWIIFNLYDMAGKPVENLQLRSVKEGDVDGNKLLDESGDEKIHESEIKVLRKSLLIMEIIILRMVQFNLDDKLAHNYLVYFMNDLRLKFVSLDIWDVLIETTMKMVNDFYLTKECVNFQPDEIAVTVIEFALRLLNVNDEQFDMNYREQWLKSLTQVSKSTELQIMDIIFNLGVITPAAEEGKMKRLE